MLNQFLNLNKGIQALQKPEFIVIHELFMTPTARYADIVLPVAHFLERDDIGQPFVGGAYNIVMEKAVEPQGQAKTDLAIFTELASRLGISGFNEKTDEEWLNEFTAKSPGMPSYEALKEKKVYLAETDGPYISFKDQIENPGQHPFPTPTGKIEIYSQKIAEMQNPLIPPIPKYLESWEGPGDAAIEAYPIQLVSPHSKARVNSTLDNIPRLKKMADDSVWISIQDARSRGIHDGDQVRIRNDRGNLVVTAKVTGRIMQGVASLDAGAWYRPDESGTDRGGCVNVLTRDAKSPAGAFPSNTCLVQIDKL
jgi:anaerobic dimethyl sulfoxide reductase subunit A